MIVCDFESLPEALVAEMVTIFAPAIKLALSDNCFVTALKENAVVAAPFNVTEIWEAVNTFMIVAFTKVVFTAVVYGFTLGVVIVTTGAGVATGCEYIIVCDFESLPEAVEAVMVTMFAPAIKLLVIVNCLVDRL